MYKVILILDKFFLKYEGGGGGSGQIEPPNEKLSSRSPALLELNYYVKCNRFLDQTLLRSLEFVIQINIKRNTSQFETWVEVKVHNL